MAAAWISVIGSAVTAIAALGGVMLAQRATRARDLDGRIWACRSRAYVDLMGWILATSRAVDALTPGGETDGQRPVFPVTKLARCCRRRISRRA